MTSRDIWVHKIAPPEMPLLALQLFGLLDAAASVARGVDREGKGAPPP